MRLFAPLLIAFTLASIAPASSAEPAPAPAPSVAPSVIVSDPYVRLMPPASTRTAAFLVLENPGPKERKLIRATTDAAKVVELHTHVHEDGVMKMRPIPFIAVPAGGKTTLKPGGLHIMLIDLTRPLVEGHLIELTLTFDDGSVLAVSAPVHPINPH